MANYPRFPYAHFPEPSQVTGLASNNQLIIGNTTGLTAVAVGTGVLSASGGAPAYSLTPALTSVSLDEISLSNSSGNLMWNSVRIPDKTYVDAVINGLAVKGMCKTALFGTTGSSGANVNNTIQIYSDSNGSDTAIGTYNGTTTISITTTKLLYYAVSSSSRVAFAVGDRVLINYINSSNGSTGSALNGIYRFVPAETTCSFVRTDDANTPEEYYKGLYTYIDTGYYGSASIAGNSYILTSDPVDFTQQSDFALFTMNGGLTASDQSKLLYYDGTSTLQPSIVDISTSNQLTVGSSADSTVKVYGTSNSSSTLSNSALSFGVPNGSGSVSGSVLNGTTLTTSYLTKLGGTGTIEIGSVGTGSVAFGTSTNASGDGSVVLAVQATNANANTMVSPASVIRYAGTTANSGSDNFIYYSGLQSCLSGELVSLAVSAVQSDSDALTQPNTNVLITPTTGTMFISSNLMVVVTDVSSGPEGTTEITLSGTNNGNDTGWVVIGELTVDNTAAAQYSTYSALTSTKAYKYLKINYSGTDFATGKDIGMRSFVTGTLLDLDGSSKKEEQPLSVEVPFSVVETPEPEPVAEVTVAEVPVSKPGVLGWLFGSKAESVEVPEQVINKPSRPMSQRQINALKRLSDLDVKTIMN